MKQSWLLVACMTTSLFSTESSKTGIKRKRTEISSVITHSADREDPAALLISFKRAKVTPHAGKEEVFPTTPPAGPVELHKASQASTSVQPSIAGGSKPKKRAKDRRMAFVEKPREQALALDISQLITSKERRLLPIKLQDREDVTLCFLTSDELREKVNILE